MSELGDIMGEDFEEEYQEKSQQAREEARKVDQSTMMEICYEAINNGGFKGEEPRFRFAGQNLDHDVLLMESPDDELDKYRWDLGDTAKTQGMYHLNNLFSLAFQENMLDLLSKIEVDKYYLVVGRYEERTEQQSDGTEDTYYNINPVRGIVPLELAKQYADKYEDQLESTSVEEQSQEQSSSDSSDASIDLGDDSSGEVSDSDIVEIFQAIGNDNKEVLQKVAAGDSDIIDKVVSKTQSNLDGDTDRERILDVFEDQVQEIDGRGEEDEDDDLGVDLGDDSDSDDESESSDDDESSDSSDESSSDDGGESEDPSDWFN